MKDTIVNVKKYYDENTEYEWDRIDRHPFEFIFTTYMMDKYIKPGDTILDIGGGPGRYSMYYSQKGCDVTLVDLSDGNIQFAKEKAKEKKVSINAFSKNCLELDKLNLKEFDHVFLMGPLYHLVEEEDRIKAVKIALNHLKSSGNLYCSFILDFASIIYDLKNGPGLLSKHLEDQDSKSIIDSIVNRTIYDGPSFTSSCFYNQKQIEPFMKQFGLKKLHLFGQEGIMSPNENQVLTYPKEEFDLWIETAKKFLELPELLAYSEHAMFIGKK
ncbi:class I SAM-dependent methyltransferase [Sedimentibacter sp. zth1]|uniref:class I SAM-dependent methyltransferase n=1 Tax=Sedimentibacter sp. zth1 TaxID=2816908 RepID=UPI001A91A4C5|nr:class I SAM-dependent methyltransferase [Sedimentibacter sp. zth1]QSX06747.1 class I SAM-dependent methyltransferase [Sedimentibacter sp. zth1]